MKAFYPHFELLFPKRVRRSFKALGERLVILFNLTIFLFASIQAHTKYTETESLNKLTNETEITYARKLGYRYGTNTLGIIFFCLTFGTVLGSLGRKAKVVINFFSVIDEVIMKMVYGIMW